MHCIHPSSYLENGQGKGSRLAAPGLRKADDVLSCSHAKFVEE